MTVTNSGRARPFRIGRAFSVLIALVLGVGFAGITASAAQALPPVALAVSFNPGSVSLRTSDDPIRVTVTVKNTDPREASEGGGGTVDLQGVNEHVDLQVEGGQCNGTGGNGFDCGTFERGTSKSFTIILTPKNAGLQEGQSVNGTVTVTMAAPNSGSGSASVAITGSKQTATGIAGNVTSVDGEPLDGVAVAIRDANGATFSATTDAAGNFALNVEFAAGQVEVTFTKEGYVEATDTYVAVAGQQLRTDVRMKVATEDEPSEEPPPSETQTEEPKEDDGFGVTMWLLIILGALLVIGGIVAIVMLFRRGKDDDDDDLDRPLPDVEPMHRPSATQTGQLGVYDAARHRPGMDAPTMIHNGPLIADGDLAQYGSPPPSSPGFGPSYDNPTSGGGFGPSYDTPTSGGGFGPSYDDRRSTQRFDAPRDETRRYPQQDDHGQRPDDRGGWGGGYDAPPQQRDPYGDPPAPQRDPYGSARDPYDQSPPPRDPYDQPPPRRRYRDEDDGHQDQRHRW